MNTQQEHGRVNNLYNRGCIDKQEAQRLHKAVDTLGHAVEAARNGEQLIGYRRTGQSID